MAAGRRDPHGISIEHGADIAPGLYIGHFGGIVVGNGAKVGSDCDISQGVTIGASGEGERRGSPVIGQRVYVGPGAKLCGPITVGDGARVDANAVVNRDVPAGATAVGIPARVVGEDT